MAIRYQVHRTGLPRTQQLSSTCNIATSVVRGLFVLWSFGLLAVAKPALTVLVGEEYAGGTLPLIIFSGAFAVTAFTAVLSPVLLALEETKVAAAITAVSVAMSLVVAYVLLLEYGMVGASVARAFAIILVAALTILMVSRKMTLQVDILAVKWRSS